MGWSSAVKEKPTAAPAAQKAFAIPTFDVEAVDWDRLVTLDFETFFSDEYTLRKQSTSEYIRDPRFKAQMVGIRIGRGATKIYPAAKIRSALSSIVWRTHALLCHHTQFDGFILAEHYGIQPAKLYCTLSMARALHSQDIGAGLDDVSIYYGGYGKIKDTLEETRGVLKWGKDLTKRAGVYCANDVDETLRIFKLMLPKLPRDEIDMIDVTCRMFTDPVLKVDIPRVEAEVVRELAEKKEFLLSIIGDKESQLHAAKNIKFTKAEDRESDARTLAGESWTVSDVLMARMKKVVGSSEKFAELLRAEGVDPPRKISPAWIKTPVSERIEEKKYAYAFAQTDLSFQTLLEDDNPRIRALVEARFSVKSNTNVTRAGRFLTAGANGASLPVYLKYAAAHTMRWGGGNKMNMQNLTRGGELRKSIKAPPGHQVVVADSEQIEPRVNAWLWGQNDLLDGFWLQDTGKDRDVYCKFGDVIYNQHIDKKLHPDERFVAKVGVLMLGYQAGAERLRTTLALGTMGPKVFLDLDECRNIVNKYRQKNVMIKAGWRRCERIIEDMSLGRTGSWKCLNWSKDTIYLPNGVQLHYPNVQNKALAARVAHTMDPANYPDPPLDEWVYIRKGQEQKIYGGLLCENLVQALSRIIVGVQMLSISKFARVVMMSHDEVVTITKTPKAPTVFAKMVDAMSKPLPWCSDLPLNAAGGFDAIYSK